MEPQTAQRTFWVKDKRYDSRVAKEELARAIEVMASAATVVFWKPLEKGNHEKRA